MGSGVTIDFRLVVEGAGQPGDPVDLVSFG